MRGALEELERAKPALGAPELGRPALEKFAGEAPAMLGRAAFAPGALAKLERDVLATVAPGAPGTPGRAAAEELTRGAPATLGRPTFAPGALAKLERDAPTTVAPGALATLGRVKLAPGALALERAVADEPTEGMTEVLA